VAAECCWCNALESNAAHAGEFAAPDEQGIKYLLNETLNQLVPSAIQRAFEKKV